MKKNYLLLLTFLCPLLSFAQFLDQEYLPIQKEWGKTNTVLVANGQTYVGGISQECPGPLLYALNSDNQLLWYGNLETTGDVQDLDFNPATNAIAGCGHHDQFGDVISPYNGPAIFSFDEDGNNIFTTILDAMTYGIEPYGNPLSISHTNNGGWVVSVNEHLIWFNASGGLLNVQSFDETVFFQKIEWVNENQLVAITQSELFILDHNGNTLQTQNLSNIQSVYVEAEKIYCLKETELIIYDPSDQSMISHSDYMANIDAPQGICGNNNSLFIYEKNNSNADFEKVIQLDITTLQYQNEFYFEQENTALNEIVANENSLFIGGSMKIYNPLDLSPQFDTHSGRLSFLKTAPIFEEPSFTANDIGISNFVIIDPLVPIDTVEVDFDSWVYFESPYINVTYDITNYGSSPITAFGLLSNEVLSANYCFDFRVYKTKLDYVISPGETLTISDSLYMSEFNYLSKLPDLEISLSAFAPNYSFDGDRSNNIASMQGSLFLVSNKESQQLNGIFLSPNPAKAQLRLSFETTYPDADLFVYDIFGKLIYEQKINNQEQLNIRTEDWPAGTYVVMVRKNNKLFTEKVVKI